MKRVEVIDALFIMEVEDRKEADDDARERQRVEYSVKQFHVYTSKAPADTVEKYG